jgi:hypothetical protein
MTDWQTRLREADVSSRAAPDPADVRRVRETVLAAVRQAGPETRTEWRRPLALIAAMLIVVVGGITASWQAGSRRARPADTPSARQSAADSATVEEPGTDVERQQLQFATPGGTRIIWVFDSKFDIRGTLP